MFQRIANVMILSPCSNITAAQLNLVLIPKVAGVSIVNAKTIQVAFNTAIKADTVVDDKGTTTDLTDDTLKAGAISATQLDGNAVNLDNAKASLSADGKTLTLIVSGSEFFGGRYDVAVPAGKILTTTLVPVEKYQATITLKDTTAPTIVSNEKTSATTFKVKFSEPIKAIGSYTFKLADGTVLATATSGTPTGVLITFTAGNDYATFTLGSAVTANKVVTGTFVGAQDYASNLLTPNPATVTFTRGEKDGIAPTVSSVTQTGAKEISILFSEELVGAPAVTVGAQTGIVAVKDTTNPLKYTVTTTAVLDGATTVAIPVQTNWADLSLEPGVAYSKVFTFTKDTVAPTVTSATVVQNTTDGLYYLQVAFDKNVNLSTPTIVGTGTMVKDYISTAVTSDTATPVYKVSTDHKVIQVPISTLLTGTDNVVGAAYNLKLAFTGIASEASVAVTSTPSVNFTLVADGTAPNTDILAAPTITQTSNDTVTVTFPAAVDGASAINTSNYSIDGAVIDSVSLAAVSGGHQVATINLVKGSNTFTGARNITVKNVKALGSSVTMDAFTETSVVLTENVAPTFTATLIDTSTIKVDFSEPIANTTLATALGASNFTVLYDGNGNTVTAVNADNAASPTPCAASTGYTTVYLKLATPIADLGKTLTVKGSSIQDVDVVGASAAAVGNLLGTTVVDVAK